MRNMQLIEKNHLVRVTDFLISKVCNHDNSSDDMSSLLEAMETLLLIGHFWPGAEHMGSEIGVLQQVLIFHLLYFEILVTLSSRLGLLCSLCLGSPAMI